MSASFGMLALAVLIIGGLAAIAVVIVAVLLTIWALRRDPPPPPAGRPEQPDNPAKRLSPREGPPAKPPPGC